MKNSLSVFTLTFFLVSLNVMQIISFAQVDSAHFMFEGELRDYYVFLPQNYNGNDELPLLFNLHGYTLNAQQQMNYSKMNEVADTAGFLVVYPNAVATAWNCGINATAGHVNDLEFFDALIDTLIAHYSIDEERIYSCGFSLGGFMSHRLAIELSNRIAAIADVAGSVANVFTSKLCSVHPIHPTPILKFHGTADELVPYNGYSDWCSVQQTMNYWTRFNYCNPPETTSMPNIDTLDGCTVLKTKYTFSNDSGEVIFYKIVNGGHSWPGGDTAYFQWISLGPIGKTNMDINASELIWEFFRDYKLTIPTNVEINSGQELSSEYSLYQNHPNPFNPSTTIKYEIPKQVRDDNVNVILKVYDILGREMSTLVNKEQPQGNYEVVFDGNDLTSGIYFYRIQAGDFVETRKMILIK